MSQGRSTRSSERLRHMSENGFKNQDPDFLYFAEPLLKDSSKKYKGRKKNIVSKVLNKSFDDKGSVKSTKVCKPQELCNVVLKRELRLSQQRIDCLFNKPVNAKDQGESLFRAATVGDLSTNQTPFDPPAVKAISTVDKDVSLCGSNLSINTAVSDAYLSADERLDVSCDPITPQHINLESVQLKSTGEPLLVDQATTSNMQSHLDVHLMPAQTGKGSTVEPTSVPANNETLPPGWDMFASLIQRTVQQSVAESMKSATREISEIKVDLADLKKNKPVVSQVGPPPRITDVESTRMELVGCKLQMKELSGVVIRQDHMLRECRQDIISLKMQLMKPNLLIFGIVKKDKESFIDAVKNFFKNVMNITSDIPIKVAYRKGRGRGGPVYITLMNAADKGKIFKNASELKDKTNALGKSYKIEDDLPAAVREHKKRERQIIAINRKRQVSDQLNVKMEKGSLLVDGKRYQKVLKPPSCEQLLSPNIEEIAARASIKLSEGRAIEMDSSTFTGYSAAVKSLNDANQAYAKVCAANTSARHVIAAVRLPHSHFHIHQDFNDNDEHGGGKVLLKILEDSQIQNRALFVVRKYDGTHIGDKRFEGIEQAARAVLLRSPYNDVTKENQVAWNWVNPPVTNTPDAANTIINSTIENPQGERRGSWSDSTEHATWGHVTEGAVGTSMDDSTIS